MSYEIPPTDKERKFRICKYHAISAVGTNPSDREIFEKIFRRSKIDYYMCPNCRYYYIGPKYDLIIYSMKDIIISKKDVFIITPINQRVYLTVHNFMIGCSCDECIEPEAWVKEYVPN